MTPWKIDPVSRQFFGRVLDFLQRKRTSKESSFSPKMGDALIESVNADLIIRVQAGYAASEQFKVSSATTRARASWCCRRAVDCVLRDLEINMPVQAPGEAAVLTIERLEVLVSAVEILQENILIDRTEYRMGAAGTQYGAQQIGDTKMQRRMKELTVLRDLLSVTLAFLRTDSAALAGDVADHYFQFLMERTESRDHIVREAEGLAQVFS